MQKICNRQSSGLTMIGITVTLLASRNSGSCGWKWVKDVILVNAQTEISIIMCYLLLLYCLFVEHLK